MSTLSAAEWNDRYPSRLPVPVRYRNGHTDTVTTTRGAAWSDDDGEWVIVERFGPRPLAMIEPLATDEQRLAEGWLPPDKVEELQGELNELRRWKTQHLWSHDWRTTTDGTARCRHCSFGVEGDPASHQMSCQLYEGPLRHEWLHHLTRVNPSFGGTDYRCVCGGWFRMGGLAGHGDGTEWAEPVCPNADQTWRGARSEEGATNG